MYISYIQNLYSTKNSEFAYANSRIRALENKLLNNNEIERMLTSNSAEAAFQVLNELDLAHHLNDVENVSDFQKVLDLSLLDTKDLIEKISPDPHLKYLLFLNYDFNNLKAILKAKLTGEKYDSSVVNLGFIPINVLENFINNSSASLGDYFNEYLDEINNTIYLVEKHFELNNNLKIVDLYVDKLAFNVLMNVCVKTGSYMLFNFIKTSIDIHNIKSLLRIRLLGQTKYFKENKLTFDVFVANGNLDISRFLSALKDENIDLNNLFQGTDYKDLIKHSIDYFEEFNSFVLLDKLGNDTLINNLKKTKFISFGPEPLMAYFFAKQNNNQIIRMILIGKLNNISGETLRENLFTLYN